MGLKGSLRDISLENIFQMLFVERKSGLLSIQYGGRKAEVFLEQGRISFARLGEPLERKRIKLTVLKNGYLTEEEWAALIASEPVPTLENILAAFAKKPANNLLSFLLLRQIEYTFFIFLQWIEGIYEYRSGERPALDRSLWTSLDGNYLLIKGLQEVEEWKGHLLKLPSLNSVVFMVEDFLRVAANSGYVLASNDRYVASLASKELRLADLLNASRLSYCQSAKIIEQFMLSRILKVKRGQKKRIVNTERRQGKSLFKKWLAATAIFVGSVLLVLMIKPDYLERGIEEVRRALFAVNPVKTDEKRELKTGQGNIVSGSGPAGYPVGEEHLQGVVDSGTRAVSGTPVELNLLHEGAKKKAGSSTQSPVKAGEKRESGVDRQNGKRAVSGLDELRQRAEDGDVDAQLSLGFLYDFGSERVPEDDVMAAIWYRKAAEEGLAAEAQFNLGVMYSNGEGVDQDTLEAARWYRKAAAQGHAQAQYNLGLLYLSGDGVELSKERGLRLLYKSGVSFWGEGNSDALFLVIKVLRKIDPENPGAKKLLDRVYLEK